MGKCAGWDDAAVAEAARVLADRTRLRLLLLLAGGESNVTDLCGRLGLPQPSVSHHLGILRASGLVATRRDGKQVYYRLAVAPPAADTIRVAAGPHTMTVRLRRSDPGLLL